MRIRCILLLTLLSCTPDTVPLNGLPCDNGACGKRFVCNPDTNRCVPPLTVACDQTDAICPSTVADGDPCPSDGSFIPCTDDVTDCSLGCRTCETGAWSECSTPGDCDTCTDYFRDDDRDGTGITGDSQCLCEPTEPYDAAAGGDCDDSVATGATCTDTCTTYYVDVDDDGVGNTAITLSACTAPAGHVDTSGDCDDSVATGASCSDTCVTVYADTDGDSLGDAAVSISACTPPASGYVADNTDCDDTNTNCGANCTDGDSDDWCLGIDCNDGDGVCTDDCTACPVGAPQSLTLTVTNATPINPGDTVDLEIDMGSYTADVTADLSCTAEPYTVFGPHDFTGQPNLDTLGLAGQRASLQAAATTPFDQATCSDAGDFVQLQDHHVQSASLSLAPQLNLTSYGGLELSFVAAVENGSSVILDVRSCCGNGCTLASTQTIDPADISGTTNACSVQQISLPHEECAALSLRWAWPGDDFAGIDDIQIDGTVIVPAPTAGAPSIYTTSFAAGPPGTFDITCTWENGAIGPSVNDTETVTIE